MKNQIQISFVVITSFLPYLTSLAFTYIVYKSTILLLQGEYTIAMLLISSFEFFLQFSDI